MRAIWKFQFPGEKLPIIDMPSGCRILSVGRQDENITPTLWAEVETTCDPVPHLFAMIGTGEPFPEAGGCSRFEYIGTAVCGPLVWHVWDLGEVAP